MTTSDTSEKPKTITARIYELIFEILEENPEGVRWTDLNRMVKERDPSLHPKSINGCVWKMLEKYPDKVEKPDKGLFRLK